MPIGWTRKRSRLQGKGPASVCRRPDVVCEAVGFSEAFHATASRRLIRNEWNWLSVTSTGAIPKRLATLRQNVKRYILPPRRKRTYPRVVKIKISQYDHKVRRAAR